ncbi:MAG: thiolase family protein [Rhodoferax sp.]|nr:thiolase family protein [Rhodoferax sp.]
MPTPANPTALIAAWARSAVAPVGGAFNRLLPHEIAAPVVQAVLARAGILPEAVDAVVVGNAMGAGGNPARMVALASGLAERCAAFSVDTQCCSGLDAVALAAGLLASGQASVVIAGGVEAWSRAPLRHTRPLHADDPAVAYERPAFAPDPARDPDMLVSASRYAATHGTTRIQQDAYAVMSHQRAITHQAVLADEIVPVVGLAHDAYPRPMDARRAARMPTVVPTTGDCSVSVLSVSVRADGAAFVLLATPQACERLGIQPKAAWIMGDAIGCAPETPLLAAAQAAQVVLQRSGMQSCNQLHAIELHDAFAVQGLSFCRTLHVDPARINQRGGGLARGHPIGASGTIALVRLLTDLYRDGARGVRGLCAIAGAGGIGSAALVEKI